MLLLVTLQSIFFLQLTNIIFALQRKYLAGTFVVRSTMDLFLLHYEAQFFVGQATPHHAGLPTINFSGKFRTTDRSMLRRASSRARETSGARGVYFFLFVSRRVGKAVVMCCLLRLTRVSRDPEP